MFLKLTLWGYGLQSPLKFEVIRLFVLGLTSTVSKYLKTNDVEEFTPNNLQEY